LIERKPEGEKAGKRESRNRAVDYSPFPLEGYIMETIRTFIAVEIPDEVQTKLVEIQKELSNFVGRVSWVKRGNIHLTLKFLGDVQVGKIEAIKSSLEKVAESHSPFKMSFGRVGTFPNFNRPRVIWLGIKVGAEESIKLAESVEHALGSLGFPRERKKLRPHLTLARIRRRMNLESVSRNFSKYDSLGMQPIKIDGFTLMQSQLHPKGSIYTPLAEFTLKNN